MKTQLSAILLSSALGFAASGQAHASGVDKFVCLTETPAGPAALFHTNATLITGNAAPTPTLFGNREAFYEGSTLTSQNSYSRNRERLESSVEGYEAQIKIGTPDFTAPETMKNQLAEWKKGLDAIKFNKNKCADLIM